MKIKIKNVKMYALACMIIASAFMTYALVWRVDMIITAALFLAITIIEYRFVELEYNQRRRFKELMRRDD